MGIVTLIAIMVFLGWVAFVEYRLTALDGRITDTTLEDAAVLHELENPHTKGDDDKFV